MQGGVSVGWQSGERMCAFPLDEDYGAGLDSRVADIKQHSQEGDAGRIIPTHFLKRFAEHDTPYLHVDLAATTC